MTSEREDKLKRHLTSDEIERCALAGSTEDRPAPLAAHLEGCAACRHEVVLLEALDRDLAALPHLEPSPGFAARVMNRVRLPEPWHEKAWAGIRRRWAVLAAGMAAATLTVGGMALLSLLSCGALWMMRRLAQGEPARLPRPARS